MCGLFICALGYDTVEKPQPRFLAPVSIFRTFSDFTGALQRLSDRSYSLSSPLSSDPGSFMVMQMQSQNSRLQKELAVARKEIEELSRAMEESGGLRVQLQQQNAEFTQTKLQLEQVSTACSWRLGKGPSEWKGLLF